MASIYELTNNYKQVELLIESGDIDEDVLRDTLEAIEGDIEEKVEGYGKLCVNLSAQAEALANEANRLMERAKYYQNQVSKLQDNLAYAMIQMDKDKIKTDHFNVGFRKSQAVDIVSAEDIPEAFIVTKVTETSRPDKTAIKKAIKAGEEVPGATLLEKKNFYMK